jgi:phosphoribosylformylglycinamidine synthase
MNVRVYVTPKQGILDPQGAAVERSLPNLGFQGVSGVRIGKIIDLTIDGAASEEAARAEVDDMCRKLLSNPIIEDYTFEIEG